MNKNIVAKKQKSHKKKLIFFDADGTLWYPKRTKYNGRPWWIYFDDKTKDNPLVHLTLTPRVKTTLKKLKELGVQTVLIAQMPYPKYKANKLLTEKTKYFGIFKYFDQIRASHAGIRASEPDPKDIAILEVIKDRKIPKSKALLVGDSYKFDYLAAKNCGIDCLLIDSFKHTKEYSEYKRVKKRIKNIGELLDYV